MSAARSSTTPVIATTRSTRWWTLNPPSPMSASAGIWCGRSKRNWPRTTRGRSSLTLKDGSTRDKVVVHPRGTGDRGLTNAAIVGKYRSLTSSVISTNRQTALEKTVLNLDALDDISELTALLTPTVRSALD